MQQITPYRTKNGALTALDNGGRFYNLFTKANDGEISMAELGKVAGAFVDTQRMFLYFEMALAHLDAADTEAVIAAMSGELRSLHHQCAPLRMSVARAREHGHAAQSVIVTGIPHHVDSKTEFSGFIMIPIQTGNVTSMTMIPIMDQYDVYEVRDEETDSDFLIAHARGSRQLPATPLRLGGVIKELQKKDDDSKHRFFLETLFYSHA